LFIRNLLQFSFGLQKYKKSMNIKRDVLIQNFSSKSAEQTLQIFMKQLFSKVLIEVF